MLMKSNRHTQDDLEVWESWEGVDAINAKKIPDRKIEAAIEVIKEAAESKSYVSVSWGKDSVVTIHLCQLAGVDLPAVWIKEKPMFNPGCEGVRDVFLSLFPGVKYHEIVCDYGTSGFAPFLDKHGDSKLFHGIASGINHAFGRRITGIRADESKERKLRMIKHGLITKNTACPIAWWSNSDVFAYLYKFGLPVHQNYAMTNGGLIDRPRIRVDCIAGRQGNGIGRDEWERQYYPEIVNRIAKHEN